MDPRRTSHEIPSQAQLSAKNWKLSFRRNIAILQNGNLIERIQAPEIQTMYNIPLPVSTLRTRIREEFERNRHASNLSVVDVLLFKSHAEYQVRMLSANKKSQEKGKETSC